MSLNVKAYVDVTSLVLGPQEKDTGVYQIHPLIRESWAAKDWFKDAQSVGQMMTAYDSYYNAAAGSYDALPGTELYHITTYGSLGSAYGPYPGEVPHVIDPVAGYAYRLGTPADWAGPRDTGLWAPLPAVIQPSWQPSVETTFSIYPNNEAWNAGMMPGTSGSMENFLSQEGHGTWWAGDPYFVSYTDRAGGLDPADDRMAGSTSANQSIFTHMRNAGWIHDHTFKMLESKTREVPPDLTDPLILTDVGVAVTPVYNYFLDTDPDYESVISEIPESLIPNYYMVEECFRIGAIAGATHADFPFMSGVETSTYTYPMRFGFKHNEGSEHINQMTDLFLGVSNTFAPGPEAPYGNRQGFFQLYSSIMSDIIAGNTDTTKDTAFARAENNFRDVAVLTGDRAFIEGANAGINIVSDNRGTPTNPTDDMLAIDGYPYYNLVTINVSPDTGISAHKPSGYSVTNQTYGIIKNLHLNAPAADFKFLVNMLQMLVCKKLSNTGTKINAAAEAIAVDLPHILTGIFKSTGNTDAVFARGNDTATTAATVDAGVLSSTDANYPLTTILELERLIYFLDNTNDTGYSGPGDYSYQLADGSNAWSNTGIRQNERLSRQLMAAYTYNNNAAQHVQHKNFMNLRDFEDWPYSGNSYSDFIGKEGMDAKISPTTILMLLGQITSRTRSLGQTLAGEPAYSETFMYVVEKRVIPSGQTSASPTEPVVQKLYFGMDYDAPDVPINYIDTQIKYGVRYQYDLKEIRVVVGNRYKYTGVDIFLNQGDPGQGRAIANALGFYQEEGARANVLEPLEQKLEQYMGNPPGWPFPPYAEEDQDVRSDASLWHPRPPATGISAGASYGYYLYKLTPGHNIMDLVGGPYHPLHNDTAGNPQDYVFNFEEIVGSAGPEWHLSVDWNFLRYQIKGGFGMGGNETGGAIPFRALGFTPEEAGLPPVEYDKPVFGKFDWDKDDDGEQDAQAPTPNEWKNNPMNPGTALFPDGNWGQQRGLPGIFEDEGTLIDGEEVDYLPAKYAGNVGQGDGGLHTIGGDCPDPDQEPQDYWLAYQGPNTTEPPGACYDYIHAYDSTCGALAESFIRLQASSNPPASMQNLNGNIVMATGGTPGQTGGLYWSTYLNGNASCHTFIQWHFCNTGTGGSLTPECGYGTNQQCFIAGTQITRLSETGQLYYTNIEDLRVGDYVASYNFETGEIEPQRILEAIVASSDQIVEFEYSDGTLSQHTPGHPYYIPNKGWCSYSPRDTTEDYSHPELRDIQVLAPGDRLQSDMDTEMKLISMTQVITDEVSTYNIKVENSRNYYADRALVHNKGGA